MTGNIRAGKRSFARSLRAVLMPGQLVVVLSLLLSNVAAVQARIPAADATGTETPTTEVQVTDGPTTDALAVEATATEPMPAQPPAEAASVTATPSAASGDLRLLEPDLTSAISFNKIAPANLSLVVETDQFQLKWSDAGIDIESPGGDRYMYCVDETNDNICNTTWVPKRNLLTAPGDVVVVVGHTYYWQVHTEQDNVYANCQACWWSFTVVPSTTKTISGVTGLPGTKVGYAGTTSGMTTAGAGGAYSITVPNHWTGTVTPSLAGYSFSPGSRAYLDVMANQINQNYTPGLAVVYTISGDAALDGVTMSFAGAAASGSSPSVLGGGYSFAVPSGWSGVVTPFKPGYVFTPTNRAYFGVLANQTSQDFAIGNLFADVPVFGKEWMEPWIVAFYQHGVTNGCGNPPLIYCPENSVTRAEMAVFLLRARHGAGYTPPAATAYFADVPVAGKEWMEPWIDQYYREGLTSGCGGGNFCPENNVTRAEMAVFVLRAIHTLGWAPPPLSHYYSDMPVSGKEWMEPWVDELTRQGITTGCGGGMYCPESSTTRAEMAVFIGRAFHFYP